MLKACIRASRQTLRTPDHILSLKCYMWVESNFFVVLSYSLCYPKQYCFSKKRKQRASNSTGYSIPNMYSANRSCIEGLTDFAKSCVATHISEDMDRLTDCVGQCTICRSIPSELYEATQSCHWSVTLQKLKMGTYLKCGLKNDLFTVTFSQIIR